MTMVGTSAIQTVAAAPKANGTGAVVGGAVTLGGRIGGVTGGVVGGVVVGPGGKVNVFGVGNVVGGRIVVDVEELVVEVDEVDEVVVVGVVVVAGVVVVVLVDVGAPVVVVTASQPSGKDTGPAVAVSPATV